MEEEKTIKILITLLGLNSESGFNEICLTGRVGLCNASNQTNNQCSLILETIGGMTPASVSQPNKPSCQS